MVRRLFVGLVKMDDQINEILNTCMSSSRRDITGFYFYDCMTKTWQLVTESQWIITSFTFSFGARWGQHQHKIIKSKKVNKKMAEWLLTVSLTEFNKVRV